MKKLIKIILGIVIGIIVLALIILTILFFVVRDSTEIVPEHANVDKAVTPSLVLNTELEKATHNVSTTKNVDLLLDETALEYLFLSIVKQINMQDEDMGISGVDVDVENETYNVELGAKLFFYRTVFRCGLSFEETSDAFVIHLENLKAGSLNLLTIGKPFTIFINTDDIEKGLAENNIYCKVNLSDYTITFTKDNIKKMLSDSLGEDQRELVNVLCDIFLSNKDILELNLGKDNLLGAILHLQMIKYNASEKGALPYSYNFLDLAQKTNTLLSNNIISLEEVNTAYKFLVNGYDAFDDDAEGKAIIDKTDFSSVGINSKKTYEGIMNKSEENSSAIIAKHVRESLAMSLEQMIINRGFSLTITDDVLTEALKKTPVVGFSYSFANDETKDVGYIVVEQLNMICLDNQIVIDLIININGEQIYIEIKLDTAENSAGLSLTGTINSISIGSKQLSEENNLALIRYLNTATSDIEWIEVNPQDTVQNSTITLNFTQILNNDTTISSFIAQMATLSLSITNQTKVVNGGIVITYRH